ncbi:MAG: putative Fe-S cluster assembly protein SufT [Gammaproteobacteria bacterium]|nr:putative Fe-S cluster assembly protein SufT [Gammaproteobacteria bacterium]
MGDNIDLYEPITVARDCDAVLIPSGAPITVPSGTVVYITQALGGSVTVNVNGNLARIAGRDLDALGMELEQVTVAGPDMSETEALELVWDQLRTCYDPEIPINVVELGLVYDCRVETITATDEGHRYRVYVAMTLTAPGCGMGDIIVEDIRAKLRLVPRVAEVEIDLVFDPPWDPSMMSESARLQTGMF